MAPSSCDALDTPRLAEVTQLLGQKHIFLMAKAELPVAICTLGIKHNTDEEQSECPTVSIHLPVSVPRPGTPLRARDISHTHSSEAVLCTVISISEASLASTT